MKIIIHQHFLVFKMQKSVEFPADFYDMLYKIMRHPCRILQHIYKCQFTYFKAKIIMKPSIEIVMAQSVLVELSVICSNLKKN